MIEPIDLSDNAPWKQRFHVPLLLKMNVASTNPARGLVVGDPSGSFQLHAWNTAGGELRQLTNRPSDTDLGWIAPNGEYVYFLNDQQGNEQGHLTRIPFEGGECEDVTPNLVPYTLRGVGLSQNGTTLAFDAVNANGFQLYVMPLGIHGELGEPHLIYCSEKEAWGALLSSDGQIAAMISTARAGGQRHRSLLAINTANGNVMGEVWDGPEADIEIVAFSPLPGDARILAMTSRSGFRRPFVWDPLSDERVDLAGDSLEGDIIPLDWSPGDEQILLCQMNRAQQQLYRYNLPSQVLVRLDHPSGTFYYPTYGAPGEQIGPCFGSAGEIWGLWEDSTHPPHIKALDFRTGNPTRVLVSVGDVLPGHPLHSITFFSSDGQEIQAWLGVPDGEPPFPMIFEIHGGPHVMRPNYFIPSCQTWLDYGFAYCAINYRGSTTFGRAFKERIWGDVGHWELEDIAAARTWLVERGIATSNKIFLFGSSYGGFLTLLALGKQPELWAGGMALAAVADVVTTYEDCSAALKTVYAGLLGGTPGEKCEQYIASSPITCAESVQAPVLIFQGRNDTRTPARQMELYEAKMKSLSKDLEVLWHEAGHSGISIDQAIGFQEKMLLFAQRVLNERH